MITAETCFEKKMHLMVSWKSNRLYIYEYIYDTTHTSWSGLPEQLLL
jgi:hypothetical protein